MAYGNLRAISSVRSGLEGRVFEGNPFQTSYRYLRSWLPFFDVAGYKDQAPTEPFFDSLIARRN